MESVFSCIKWTLYSLPHKMWGLSETMYVKFWVQSKVFNIVNVLFLFPYWKADITFLPLKIYLISVTLLNVKKYQTYSLSLQDKMHFTYSDIQDSQMIFASLTFHYTHHYPTHDLCWTYWSSPKMSHVVPSPSIWSRYFHCQEWTPFYSYPYKTPLIF